MRYGLTVMFTTMLMAGSAFAHSHVAATNPQDGAVLEQSPSQVRLTFHEILRPAESSITVLDSGKKPVTDEKATIGANQKSLQLALPSLEAGDYQVKWNAVCMCADHHATHGQFHFTVK